MKEKRKHRSGVLGRPGQPPDPKECDLSFGQLLNDAIAKNPPYSLVVFLDTNVPPETAKYFFRQDEKGIPSKINALLERVKKHHKGVDLINLAVFTNLPHHYAEGNELDPPKNLIAVRSDRAKIPAQHPEAIWAIAEAANLYGHIPKELPTRND